MNRKEFLRKSFECSLGAATIPLCCGMAAADEKPKVDPKEFESLKMQAGFLRNWISDLLGAMDKQLDEATYVQLMESCGEGCYHRFKEFLVREANGDIDKLVELYNSKWAGPGSVTRRAKQIEVVYRLQACTCPVAYSRAPKPDEMRCHCSKGSIKAIFSAVAGKPLKVDLIESIRRGDRQCRFLIHLA